MTDTRGGFALIAVLWLVATMAILTTAGLSEVRLDLQARRNRIGESRALWAARGCLALLRARTASESPDRIAERLDLGPASCQVEPLQWDERVNPNFADSLGLARVLRDTVQVASLLDWIDSDSLPRGGGAEIAWYVDSSRPSPRNALLRAVEEMLFIRGFENVTIEDLEATFTVRGNGRISVERAPMTTLAALSMLDEGDVRRLAAVRQSRALESPEDVMFALGWEPSADEFRRLSEAMSVGPLERTVRIHGWSQAGTPRIDTRLDVRLSSPEGGSNVLGLELR